MSYAIERFKFKTIQDIHEHLIKILGFNISYGYTYYRIKVKKESISKILESKGALIPPSSQDLRLSQNAKKSHNKRYKNCMVNEKNNILRMKLQSTDLQLI